MRSTSGAGALAGVGTVDDWLAEDWLPGFAVKKLDVSNDGAGLANGN